MTSPLQGPVAGKPRGIAMLERIARWSALLGTAVFVLGIIGLVYVLADSGEDASFYSGGAQGKVYLALAVVPPLAIAAGIAWAIAAYIWVHIARDDA